ncbi:MAG TPA: hypothetical protein VNP94_01620 [Actinomycetota bacterium]|nr:hypothetical protein [Actinomycetota bacterium]
MGIRIRTVAEPFESADPEAAREAVEALVLAEAMGLLGEEEVERLDLAALRRVARAAAEAGIGTLPAAALAASRVDADELHAILRTLREALEDSPTPSREWAALLPLFGAEDLARLLGVSPVSVRRYASGSRPTPDPVAARLHFLARVVAELKGAYNDVGVRRWFHRKRTALGGKAPAQVLTGDWSPEDRGARKVLDLARSLAFSPAT